MTSNLPNGARARARSWSDTGSSRSAPSRRSQLFIVALALLALVAVLTALVLMLRQRTAPFLLSIPVTEYLDPRLPVNAFARPDSEALTRLFPGSHKLANSQERSLLEKDLESLKGTSAETVLVHLSALARADERGIYLLPGDAEVDDPIRWLQLERVLLALRNCPARHKLLLLDVQRGSLGPRLGLLADHLAEPLFQALEQAVQNDPALWVLCPCSAGQVSLTSDDLGQSVFGHYLVKGLEGRADGYNAASDPDRLVSLDELSHFLTIHVDRWARQNRGIAQVPRLFGRDPRRASEFVLTAVRPIAPPPEKETASTAVQTTAATAGTAPAAPTPAAEGGPPSSTYPAWLLKGWELRDNWTGDTLAVAPAAFAQLEANLLRAEQLWRGRNVTEADAQKELTDSRDTAEKEATSAHRAVPRPGRPHSLALTAGLGEKLPEQKEIQALRKLADEALLAARVKESAPREAFQAKLDKERAVYRDRPFALAWIGFEAAVEDIDLDPARLRFYVSDWIKPAGRPGFFAETQTLERLTGVQTDTRSGLWPKDAIHLALRVTRVAEQVAACQAAGRTQPRTLVWIAPTLARLDEQRRQAEDLLRGPASQWPEAVRLLERTGDEYASLRGLVEAAAAAEQARDEALASLPAHAAWQMMRLQPDDRDDTAWFRAVTATATLADFLAATGDRSSSGIGETVQEIQRQTRAVSGPLDELQQRVLREQVDVPSVRQSPRRVFEADLLLQTSILSAPKRAVLWRNMRQLAVILHQQTEKLDRTDFDLERRPAPGTSTDNALGTDHTDFLRRFRYLAGLLKLGGSDGVKALERLEKEARDAATAGQGRQQELAAQVRKEATHAVQKQLQEHLIQRRFRAADRLERVVHPFERHVLQPITNLGMQPAVELRRHEARALWLALADRCRDEARWLAGQPTADFYSRAAEDYLHYAR